MICRVCDSSSLNLAIDLGMQPWANHFLKPEEAGHEPVYPLRVVHCQACGTAQLDYTVTKEVMFSDHTYLSGITRSLSEHFRQLADQIDRRFTSTRPVKAVLDIGSNDGTQLRHFKGLGFEVLGVESSKGTAALANGAGIPTVNAFFNLDFANQLGRQFDIINASGVFFHLEELHSVTEGIRHALKDDGVFVVQFLYMRQIVKNLAFDQIYHEHLLYYNLSTLQTLLSRHGLKIFDAYLAPIHGGSMIAFVTKRPDVPGSCRLHDLLAAEQREESNALPTYLNFARDITRLKRDNVALLRDRKRSGKKLFGFGAPVKGNTLLNYFGIGPDVLDCLVERNELREGLVSPGTHIPIRIERKLTEQPDVYYVLAWNFRDEILERNRGLIERGVEFIFPINPCLA
jgi:SAM-dependent methyltransferase